MNLTKEQITILNKIPFYPVSQSVINSILKDELSLKDITINLSTLLSLNLIELTEGKKGPEYSKSWNTLIDEERKQLTKSITNSFENIIFYPRFESYVANIEDNFKDNNYQTLLNEFGKVSLEYTKWHKNTKTNIAYPPKLNNLLSPVVLSYNNFDTTSKEVEYAKTLNAIKTEQTTFTQNFDMVVNTEDTTYFVLGNVLEHFQQPFKPILWFFQNKQFYQIDDEYTAYDLQLAIQKIHTVYVDLQTLLKELISVVTEVTNNKEKYQNKKVVIKNIYYNYTDTTFTNLSQFQEQYNEEAKQVEELINEEFKKFNVSIEFTKIDTLKH